MKLIKMKFILALIFICNIASLQVQLDEGLPFYNTFNDQLLKAKLSFADSKKNVENIYSLKSDEKSRVLILDYVEAHDQLLTICDTAAELLSIYVIVPKSEINNELINTLEKKYDKEMILSYKFEYDKLGNRISTTLLGTNLSSHSKSLTIQSFIPISRSVNTKTGV